jgi:hypothetical protein
MIVNIEISNLQRRRPKISNNSNNNNKDEIENHTIETDSYLYDSGQLSNSFCDNCGVIFYFDITFDIYKVNHLFLCSKCYFNIQRAHVERGVKWSGEQSWYGVRECQDLQ